MPVFFKDPASCTAKSGTLNDPYLFSLREFSLVDENACIAIIRVTCSTSANSSSFIVTDMWDTSPPTDNLYAGYYRDIFVPLGPEGTNVDKYIRIGNRDFNWPYLPANMYVLGYFTFGEVSIFPDVMESDRTAEGSTVYIADETTLHGFGPKQTWEQRNLYDLDVVKNNNIVSDLYGVFCYNSYHKVLNVSNSLDYDTKETNDFIDPYRSLRGSDMWVCNNDGSCMVNFVGTGSAKTLIYGTYHIPTVWFIEKEKKTRPAYFWVKYPEENTYESGENDVGMVIVRSRYGDGPPDASIYPQKFASNGLWRTEDYSNNRQIEGQPLVFTPTDVDGSVVFRATKRTTTSTNAVKNSAVEGVSIKSLGVCFITSIIASIELEVNSPDLYYPPDTITGYTIEHSATRAEASYDALDTLDLLISGGSVNTDPAASLGGPYSSTSVSIDLFSEITAEEAVIHTPTYRCIYLLNNFEDSFRGGKIYISGVNGIQWYMGVDPSGVGGEAQQVTTEYTSPVSVEWVEVYFEGKSLTLPTIPPNTALPLWIRRVPYEEAKGLVSCNITIIV